MSRNKINTKVLNLAESIPGSTSDEPIMPSPAQAAAAARAKGPPPPASPFDKTLAADPAIDEEELDEDENEEPEAKPATKAASQPKTSVQKSMVDFDSIPPTPHNPSIVQDREVAKKQNQRKANQAAQAAAPKPVTLQAHTVGQKVKPTTAAQTLMSAMPNERFRVNARNVEGRLDYINDFSPQDVARDGSLAVFVKRRISPRYPQYTEFEIEYVDPNNVARFAGIISLAAENPLGSSEVQGSAMTAEQIAEKIDKARQDARKEGSSNMLKELKEFTELQNSLKAASGDAAKSSGGGGFSEMLMPILLMKMLEKPEPVAPPKTDETLIRLLEKFDKRLDQIEERVSRVQSQPMAPSLPPVMPEPRESMTDVVKVVVDLMERRNSANPQQPPMTPQDVLMLIKAGKEDQSERITTKDIITLLPSLKTLLVGDGNNKTPSDLESALAALRTLRQAKDEIFPDPEPIEMPSGAGIPSPDAGSNFWDFAVEALKAFREINAQAPGGSANRDAQLREAAQRAHAAEQAKIRQAQQQHQPRQPGQQTQPGQPGQPAQQTQPGQPNQQTQPKPGAKAPSLPPGFAEKLALAGSSNDPQIAIQSVLEALQIVSATPKGMVFVTKMLSIAKEDKKEDALKMLSSFLDGAVTSKIFPIERKMWLIEQFSVYWKEVRAALNMADDEAIEVDDESQLPEEPGAAEQIQDSTPVHSELVQ